MIAGERDAIVLERESHCGTRTDSQLVEELILSHVPQARGREPLRDPRGQGAAAVAERGARFGQAQRRGA